MQSPIHFPKETGFSRQELERRIQETRKEMAARGLDAILSYSPSNICYLTGHHSVNLWDYQCLILPLGGDPVMVLWEFELGRFQASSQWAQAMTYATHEDPIALTTQTLARLGLSKSRLGIELTSAYLPVQTFQTLAARLPDARVVSGSGAVETVRLVKSEEEVQCLRKAASMTCQGMQAGLLAVHEGTLDNDVAAEATKVLIRSGSDLMCIEPIAAAGYRSGLAHSTFARKRLEQGEPVFLEMGGCVRRYTAPLMRTAVVGRPSEQLRRLADASLKAVERLIAAIRPGVIASEVAKAGKAALAPVESEVVFHYVFGYSVGVGFPPSWLEESGFYLRADNHRQLQPGMVFHLPMTLRIFGHYGVGFSETVLVTKTGSEVLTQMERSLSLQ